MVAIAVFNRKGGVGKTSLSADLSYAFSQEGLDVGAIDLDPQANLSLTAGLGTDAAPDRTVARLLLADLPEFRDVPVTDTVHPAPWGGTIIPASTGLTLAENELARPDRIGAAKRLATGLQRLSKAGYNPDVLLMDCPPAVSILSINALIAARWVLVPTGFKWKEVAGLAALMKTVAEVREFENANLEILAVVPTRVDERTRHTREIAEQLRTIFGQQGVLAHQGIRATVRVEDAHAAHQAVGQYYPHEGVSDDYRQLARELVQRAQLVADARR